MAKKKSLKQESEGSEPEEMTSEMIPVIQGYINVSVIDACELDASESESDLCNHSKFSKFKGEK